MNYKQFPPQCELATCIDTFWYQYNGSAKRMGLLNNVTSECLWPI